MKQGLKTIVRNLVSAGLFNLCAGLDQIPYYDRTDHRWLRTGGWGCQIGISQLAFWIEEET